VKRLAIFLGTLIILSAGLFLPPAAAQQNSTQPSSSSSPDSTLVDLRGQFYLPWGEPLQQSIRFRLLSDDASRPPDYVFTDSKGSFVLYRVRPYATYSIVVESDGKNWGATTSRFLVSGGRSPTIQIQLEPFRKDPVPGGRSISSASLQQKIPGPARKQFESALKLIDKNKDAAAQPLLERAIELFPDYVDARNELAVALLKAGNLTDAEQQLRRALAVDSTAVRPLLNLGLCLQRQQRYAEAEPFLEKAVQLRPDHAPSLLLLGTNLVLSGDDTHAEPQLLRAYDLGGTEVARANLLLAQLYTRRKDYARAAAALETYLRDVPDAPDASHLREILDQLRLRAAADRPR
jgi:Flp pilus assembly protein TadD